MGSAPMVVGKTVDTPTKGDGCNSFSATLREEDLETMQERLSVGRLDAARIGLPWLKSIELGETQLSTGKFFRKFTHEFSKPAFPWISRA